MAGMEAHSAQAHSGRVTMGKARSRDKKTNGNGANLGFEEKLWAAADKLRGHMDAAEYKHVVLGLIFLKYISDAFQELHDRLAADKSADAEDRDEYTTENVFWVPKRRALGEAPERCEATDHRKDH